jgi:hypothetical protein
MRKMARPPRSRRSSRGFGVPVLADQRADVGRRRVGRRRLAGPLDLELARVRTVNATARAVLDNHALRTRSLQALRKLALDGNADVGEAGHAHVANGRMAGSVQLRLETGPVGATEGGRQITEILQQRGSRDVVAFGHRTLSNVGETAREARVARRPPHQIGELRGHFGRPGIPFVRIETSVPFTLRLGERRMHRRQKTKDFPGYLRTFFACHLTELPSEPACRSPIVSAGRCATSNCSLPTPEAARFDSVNYKPTGRAGDTKRSTLSVSSATSRIKCMHRW